MFYCLVVGSRDFDNYKLLCEKLDYLLMNQKEVIIVSGGAKGADTLAERYANEHGYGLTIFRANWNIGKKAGFLRNLDMHKHIASFENRGVVAFWNGTSKGTEQSFELAVRYNNPIRIYNYITNQFITIPHSGA